MTPVPAAFRRVALLAATALALPGSALAAHVKVGVINSMTGPEAPIGENLTNGIKLAEEDLKKKGIDLQVVWEDDTGKPQISMSAMEKLATRDGVAGVVGPYTSACANAVAKLAEKYKVPQVIPAAAKEDITRQGYKYVFRMNAPADVYAAVTHRRGPGPRQAEDHRLHLREHRLRHLHHQDRQGVRRQEGPAGRRRRVLLQGLARLPLHPHQGEGRQSGPGLHGLLRGRRHPAHAAVARDRPLARRPSWAAAPASPPSQFAKEGAISNDVFTSTQWTEDVNWPGAKDFANRYKAKFGKEPTYHAACAYAVDDGGGRDGRGQPAATATRPGTASRPASWYGHHGRGEVRGLRRLHQPEQPPDAGAPDPERRRSRPSSRRSSPPRRRSTRSPAGSSPSPAPGAPARPRLRGAL